MKVFIRKIFSKNNYQIRLLQFIFLVVSVIGLFFVNSNWFKIGVLAYVFLETFAGNIALHRYFGHRSFEANKYWHKGLAFLGHYIGVGSVVSWVGQHRYHHEHSDSPQDVHSPKHQGILKILFGIWTVKIEMSMVRDVIKDPVLMFFHRNYWTMHILLLFLFLFLDLTLGTWLLFSIYAFPNLLCLLSGYALAIVPHLRGYRNHQIEDLSRNCWITNIYTLGEGWHNNHHAFPQKLRQGENWWEWNLPAFVIEKLIESRKPFNMRN